MCLALTEELNWLTLEQVDRDRQIKPLIDTGSSHTPYKPAFPLQLKIENRGSRISMVIECENWFNLYSTGYTLRPFSIN